MAKASDQKGMITQKQTGDRIVCAQWRPQPISRPALHGDRLRVPRTDAGQDGRRRRKPDLKTGRLNVRAGSRRIGESDDEPRALEIDGRFIRVVVIDTRGAAPARFRVNPVRVQILVMMMVNHNDARPQGAKQQDGKQAQSREQAGESTQEDAPIPPHRRGPMHLPEMIHQRHSMRPPAVPPPVHPDRPRREVKGSTHMYENTAARPDKPAPRQMHRHLNH